MLDIGIPLLIAALHQPWIVEGDLMKSGGKESRTTLTTTTQIQQYRQATFVGDQKAFHSMRILVHLALRDLHLSQEVIVFWYI